MRTECDEVADNLPLPSKPLTFDEALAIVREAMTDETATVVVGERLKSVELRCGAVAVGRTYLLPSLSSGGASLVRP